MHGCLGCMYVCAAYVCLCSQNPEQKRPLASLELELQMIVSCCVGAGNLGPLEDQSGPSPQPLDQTFLGFSFSLQMWDN